MTGPIVVSAAGETVQVPQPTITQTQQSTVAAFGIDVNIVAGGTLPWAYQEARKLFTAGVGPGCKFFGADWAGAHNNVALMGWGKGAGEHLPDLCSDHADLTGLNAVLGAITAPTRFTVHQEIQVQLEQGRLTLAEYRTDQAAVSQAIRAHKNAGLATVTAVCASYPVLFDGQPDMVTVLQGLDIDEWGSDVYITARFLSKIGGDVTNHLRHLTDCAKQLGKPWRLPEFGVSNSLANQAAIIQQVVDYCRADPTCTGFGYWLPSATTGEWYPNPAALTVLQQAVTTT